MASHCTFLGAGRNVRSLRDGGVDDVSPVDGPDQENMYERYYGLRQRPFNLTSNPRYLLLTPSHAEALSSLQYGLATRIGIIVLLGESGTGKTTVLRAALGSQTTGHHFVWMNNPILSRSDFFQHLAQGFGL